MAGSAHTSTVRDLSRRRPAHGVWLRRAGVLMLCVVVGLGVSGRLGVRSDTVSATSQGYRLSVTYAATTRSGLDVPLRIEVEAPMPFAGSALEDNLVLEISREYLGIYEQQGFQPEPASVTSDGDRLRFTFDTPPAGSRFTVDYDAYIQPAAQAGADARVALVVDDARVAEVVFSTVVLP